MSAVIEQDSITIVRTTDEPVVVRVTEQRAPIVTTGTSGPQGIPGPQGVQGVQGIEGPQGDTGAPGIDGADGAPGIQGDEGPQGIQGIEGAVGPQGPIGDTGAPGTPGDEGPQGIQGIQGIEGATGPQGPIGITGGPGPANSLAIGTVTTGAAGSAALATITGTAPAQTLSLTIPRGDTGAGGGVSADPSALVGLAAINGVAASLMRSDAAPALNQAIAPTWSAQHTFTRARTAATEYALELASTNPYLSFRDTDAAVDGKRWSMGASGTGFFFAINNDADATAVNFMQVARTGMVIDSIALAGAVSIGLSLTAPFLMLSAATPYVRFNETDAAANAKLWTAYVDASQMIFGPTTDAGATTPALILNRTGSSYFGKDGASGYVVLNKAPLANTGYIEFWTGDNTRRGYIGWKSDVANRLVMVAENGWTWEMNGDFTVNAKILSTAGDITSSGSGAGFFCNSRTGSYAAGLYCDAGIGRLYHTAFGDVLQFNSAGAVTIPSSVLKCAVYYNTDGTKYLQSNQGILSYGSWIVGGVVGGWVGFALTDSGGYYPTFMCGGSNCGVYQQGGTARWIWIDDQTNFTVSRACVAPSFNATSARAIKRETGAPSRVRSMLEQLRPIFYRLLEDESREQVGLIAEEVHALCPQLSDGKTISYDRLAVLLLAQWQEQFAGVSHG